MRFSLPILTAICGVLLATAAPAAESPAQKPSQCFFTRDFSSWKAADTRTLYIRVDMHRYFRLDLAGTCPALLWPNSHLVTRWQGSDSVCSALDWNLSVADNSGGFRSPCIVKTMTALTADEAAALPAKVKP